MDVATRNRAIKKTLESAFGRGKVSVRGSRGTGYGWVSVFIDWTPLDNEIASDMRAKCSTLLRAAKIDLGRCYTDDDCQYTSDMCNISFNAARYHRTMRHDDGTMSVIARYGADWQTQADADGERE